MKTNNIVGYLQNVSKSLLTSAATLITLAGLALATLPAKADPLNLQSLAVTNIGTLANNTTVTNIGAVFNIDQGSQTVISLTAAALGTNAAGTVAAGFNFTTGDGYWTTVAPITVTGTFANTNRLTASFILHYTNFTGYAQGRLDTVALAGATNATVIAVTIAQKTVLPY